MAAQANLVIGGLTDALALTRGALTPRIRRAVVVYEAELPDGSDEGGVIAVTTDGERLPADRALVLLGRGTTAVAEGICTDADGDDEEEDDE